MVLNAHVTLDARAWSDGLSAPPIVDTPARLLSGGALRRWRGTEPDMAHPRLSQHFVVLHLGGAKRVHRSGEGGHETVDARLGALTIVPASSSFSWFTEGPIEFAHLYIDPPRLARTVAHVFDRDPAHFELAPRVAVDDPVLRGLFGGLIEAAETEHPVALYSEVLFEAFLARLVATGGNLRAVARHAPYALAPARLRAVTAYIEENYAGAVELDTLAAIAGLSRFHFARAFKRATGTPPYAYLIERRFRQARQLLRETAMRPAEIAVLCGFGSIGRFSTAFKRRFGMTPSLYRTSAG